VDGVTVADSRNPAISQTNTTIYSLAVVPGSDIFDTKNVPHGAVASVYYNSTSLGGIRRMHVYTPPGYESGRDKYPVFYLLHGAGDVDGVSPVDTLNLGTRRSPLEEILRQIRAAGGVPVERDGRFQPKG